MRDGVGATGDRDRGHLHPTPRRHTTDEGTSVRRYGAGLSRSSQTPSLVLDGTDARVAKGARMWLVDRRGKRVRHGEIEIVETWSPDGSTRFASARFVTPGWFRRRMEHGWSYWSAMLGGSSSARRVNRRIR